ncbi:hypothetical protein OQA88_6674 [Cercophora sp. LCS_1]
MSPTLPFTIADIFSTTPYKGNPLAIVDAHSHPLTKTQMQLITRQFNLSETTFFFPPSSPSSKATYKLRSFLPDGKEVFGAGHNILGAWWHLANSGLLSIPGGDGTLNTFYQELGDNITPVKITRRDDDIEISIRQVNPKSHGVHPDPAGLAASLGLEAGDIAGPAQVMSTSTTHHLLVPVSGVEALNRVTIQRDVLLKQVRMADERAYGLYLFTPVGDGTFQARFFSPGMAGEDPATGSAAGPLGVYLVRNGVLETDKDGRAGITVRQGERVGRECVIRVELGVHGEEVEVDIVGGGVVVGEGSVVVPGEETVF